jgi:sugar lactone lactonase YvrE
MKMRSPVFCPVILAVTILAVCVIRLEAQPIIATQPVSQTNQPGTAVIFSVGVSGSGPLVYQWQFNGTNLSNNTITTVAGNGSSTFDGDGDAATNASLNAPGDVAFDAAGNLYIADVLNYRIRRVAQDGIITTVAGNGTNGYSGDGDAATNAGFEASGIAFDVFNNLYIADFLNNRIRKIDTSGTITTVAGNGSAAFAGDGGAATNASLSQPSAVAFDALGNLFIADHNNSRIREVGANGMITTVVSNISPRGISCDGFGNLYIADFMNNRIRKLDTNGIMTTVAGRGGLPGFGGDGGVAINAGLSGPEDVAFDRLGDLFIADAGNNRIRMVNTNGIITTVAGNGTTTHIGDGGVATNASISSPFGVTFDASGNLFIAATGNARIREVHFAGFPSLVLTNVGVQNAGDYSVIITSPYGSVTSLVATLTVTIPTTPPQIITSDGSFGFTTNQSGFGFNLSGAVGQRIVVEGSSNLEDWTPLFTNTVIASPFYFFDTAWTNFPWHFYRARLQ